MTEMKDYTQAAFTLAKNDWETADGNRTEGIEIVTEATLHPMLSTLEIVS